MNERKTKLLMGAFIAFIMITSTVGFVLNYSNSGGALGGGSIYYNGHNFQQNVDGFTVEVDGIEIRTNSFPTEIDYVDVDPSIVSSIKDNPMVQITSDYTSNNSEFIAFAAFEINNALQPLGVFTQTAFTEETELDTRVVTCDDATPFVPVILFKDSDTLKISSNSSCIIIESNDNLGFIRLKDRLIYGIYGII